MPPEPWCSNWKNECCALEPGSPQMTGPVACAIAPPVAGDALAEALHLQLLQIGGEARQAMRVGQHRMTAVAEQVPVPYGQQPQQRRQVVLPAAPSGSAGPWRARRPGRHRTAPCRSRVPATGRWPTTWNSGRRPSPTSRSGHRGRRRTRPSQARWWRPPQSAQEQPSPRARSASQDRARRALASVSWVVKVLEQMMNRVVAGSRCPVRSANCTPSTLETK